MKKSVFGLLKSRQDAETVVERLKMAGFLSDDISILFSDTSGTKDFAIQHETKAPEGTTTGGGTGATATVTAAPAATGGNSGAAASDSSSTNTGNTGPSTSSSDTSPASGTGASGATGGTGTAAGTLTPTAATAVATLARTGADLDAMGAAAASLVMGGVFLALGRRRKPAGA